MPSRNRTSQQRLVLVMGMWLALTCSTRPLVTPCAAQGPAVAKASQATTATPDRYRLIYAPLTMIEQMAEGKYLPLSQSEFDRRRRLLESPLPEELARGLSVPLADYTGRLEPQGVFAGTATWQINMHSDAAATWLKLGRPNLALNDIRWLNAQGEPIDAELGADAGGNVTLRVTHSGVLQARWAAAPVSVDGDSWTYQLRLPPGAVNRLDLQIPKEYVLESDRGVVRQIDLAVDPVAAESGSVTPRPLDLWQIELGGHHEARVRLRRRDAATVPPSYRQTTRYGLSETGLDITSDCMLDCDEAPLDELELLVDSNLRLTQVLVSGQPARWSLTPRDDSQARVLVLFDTPLVGVNRSVRITAVAPFALERPQVLPRIRVANGQWQQESARLRATPELALRRIDLQNAVERPPADADLVDRGSVVEWQCQSQDHQVEVAAAHFPNRVESRSATYVEVAPNEMVATVRIDLRSLTPDNFLAEARLGDGWNWEPIQDAESGVVGEIISSPTRPRRIRLRFNEPIPTDSWTSLTLQARRVIDLDASPLSLAALDAVSFDTNRMAPRRFMTIRAASGISIAYPDDGRMTWLSLDDLDAAETRLLRDTNEPRLILLDEFTLEQHVVLQRQTDESARVDAKLTSTTRFSGREAQETFRIQVTRLSGSLKKLRLQLTTSRAQPLRWYIETAPQRDLLSRRTVAEDGNTEQWEIDWPDFAPDSAVLIGERSWQMQAEERITLVRIEEARSQEATIFIEGPPQLLLLAGPSAIFTPIPVGQIDAARTDPLRFAFRYTPLADIFNPSNQLTVQRDPDTMSEPWSVVWRCTTNTQFDQSGVAHDEVTLWIENLGNDRFGVTLPSGSSLRKVVVNGQETTYQVDNGTRLEVPLPATSRFPTVGLRFDYKSEPLGLWNTFTHHEVALSVPVLQRVWQVWVPPEYALRNPFRFAGIRTSTRRLAVDTRPNTPFDFFDRDAWRDFLSEVRRSSEQFQPDTARFIRSLGAESATTIEQWMQQAQDLPIWVDVAALADAGVRQTLLLPASTAPDTLERGLDRLGQLNLGVLEVGNGLVLTTGSQMAQLETPRVLAGHPSCRELAEARIEARQLVSLQEPAWQHRRFVKLADWQPYTVTWRSTLNDDAPYVASGWHLTSQQADEGTQVTVYRRTTSHALSYVALLIGFSLAWWAARIRRRRALGVTAIALAGCLLLPIPFNILSGWATLGSLAGWVCPQLTRVGYRRVAADKSTINSRLLVSLGIRAGVVLLLLSLLQSLSYGQEEVATSPASNDQVSQVFVPSDDAGNPVGDYVLVPEGLHDRLMNDPRVTQGSPRWILTDATYRGVLEPTSDRSQLQVSTLTANFSLAVPSVNGVVAFPLDAQAVAALKRDALLDGRPLTLRWDPDRTSLLLPIRQAGPHELQLNFQTITLREAGSARVTLPIPSSPQASLLLTSPQDLQSIRVPSAKGTIQRREATGELRADLGPVSTLEIVWPTASTSNPAPAIDQLSWLRLERDLVRLDLQLSVDTTRYLESTLIVEADERLQLDVGRSASYVSFAPSPEPGLRRFEFSVPQTSAVREVIPLSFVLTGASGIGRIRYPRFEVVGQPVAHALGVSAGPGIVLRVEPGNGATLSVNDFGVKWGGEETPDYAYEFDEPLRGWSCQGQWSNASAQVETQSAYILGLHRTRVACVATIKADRRLFFRQRVVLPDDCVVESVDLLSSHPGRQLRWSQYGKDLVWSFDRPLEGSYRVGFVVRQTNSDSKRRLPTLEFPQTIQTTTSVDIFRETDVVLPELAPLSPPPEISTFVRNLVTRARWQARLGVSELEMPPEITVQPNERDIAGELVNVVSRREGVWQHEIELNLDVRSGVLDGLTFEIPEAWTAGLQADADLQVFYAQASRPGMMRITIWPRNAPLDPAAPIQFRGPVPVTPGEPLSIPNIRLLDLDGVQRRLYLPIRVDGQDVIWSTTLRALPADIEPKTSWDRQEDYRGFLIENDNFQVERLSAKSAIGTPRVLMSSIDVHWQSAREVTGQATFDLLPDGLDECVIDLPDQMELLLLTVDGSPLTLPADRPLTPSRILVRLTSNELPQRLRVVFQTPARRRDASTWTILAPRVGYETPQNQGEQWIELPAEQSWWTTYAPANQIGYHDAPNVSWEVAQQARLEHLDRVFQEAALTATNSTATDLARWYSVWGPRFIALSRSGQRSLDFSADDRRQWQQTVESLRQRHVEFVTQLKVEDEYQRLSTNSTLVDDGATWQASLPEDLQRRTWQFRPGTTAFSVTVPRARSAAAGRSFRFVVALVILGCGWGLQHWPQRPIYWPVRWPAAAGVVLGLAWWLFAEPSIVGWLVVGLSIAVAALLR